MQKIRVSVLVFSVAGLVGPLTRLMTWSAFSPGNAAYDFFYDLVFLVWPTLPLSVVEVNVGRLWGALLSIASNSLLYSVLGLIVGIGAKRLTHIVVTYILTCFLVVSWATWGAGFDLAFLNICALSVALLLYAIPFCLTFFLVRKREL
jgi:hypothetical protein